jgi:osmotically-inducible protein OsmY
MADNRYRSYKDDWHDNHIYERGMHHDDDNRRWRDDDQNASSGDQDSWRRDDWRGDRASQTPRNLGRDDRDWGRGSRRGGYGEQSYAASDRYGYGKAPGNARKDQDRDRGWTSQGSDHRQDRDYQGISRSMSTRRDDDRGFMEKAGDEVASWMGDDQARWRREQDHARGQSHYGRGPKGYSRSDDRIREDVSDRLTEDWHIDASNIEVTVSNGEVTLNGMVDSRDAKRHAEDLTDSVSGVRHVQNNLRVQQAGSSMPASGSQVGEAPSGNGLSNNGVTNQASQMSGGRLGH